MLSHFALFTDLAFVQATPGFALRIHEELADWKRRLAALRCLPAAARLIWRSAPKLVFWGLVIRVIVALIPVGMLWVGKLIIDRVAAAGGHPSRMTPELWWLVATEFLLAALGNVFGRIIDYCDGRVADEFSREVSEKVMRHSTELELLHFEDAAFQDLLERARTQATDRTEMLSDMGRLVQQGISLLSLSAAAVVLSPWLFLLVVACMIPAFLSESHYAFASYSLAHEVTPLRRELDYIRELCTSPSSIKEVKLFQLSGFLGGRFSEVTAEVVGKNSQLARRRLVAGSAFATLGSFGYFGAHAMLVASAVQGGISIGTLTFLTGALASSSSNIQLLLSLVSKIADQSLFLNDLFAFFAIQPAKQLQRDAKAAASPAPDQRGIEFRDVSFRYPGGEQDVLRGINLRIAPEERIALVGTNGQGKTTLVKLLARLYEPTAGAIFLDGVDLREYEPEALREKIGIIFQDFTKYEMTAKKNVAMGRIAQLDNWDCLRNAARDSGADEVIEALPQTWDQMLGRRFEGGVDLSGGQWQKLALARAYLRQAQILVLDEPTAALDAAAEHEVFMKLAELAERRMVLLISHRFSTVRMADRILVLADGVIQEEGTHDDLVARGGSYAELFELQASSYR